MTIHELKLALKRHLTVKLHELADVFFVKAIHGSTLKVVDTLGNKRNIKYTQTVGNRMWIPDEEMLSTIRNASFDC